MSDKEPTLPRPPLNASEDWDSIYLRHDRQPAYSIPLHSHSQHTLIIGLDNSLRAEWSIDGQFRDLRYGIGDVFMVPAGASHKAYWKQESEGLLLAIEPENIVNTAIDSANSDRVEMIPQFATKDFQLLQMAQWLLLELQQQQMGSPLYVESLTTAIMIHLLRNYGAVKPKIPQYTGGLAKHKLKTTIAFINDHLEQDLRLADIASLVSMSTYHFARMFKLSTGLTPHQYIVKQRLDKAKELLRYSQIAIADVGYLVGYKNSSHFTRVFRRHIKTTPKAYRNMF